MEITDSLNKKKRLNNYERALVWQTYGYIYSSLEDYSKAINAFNKCLSLNALPEGSVQDTKFNLGQLYMMNKKYKKAADLFISWFKKAKNPSPSSKHIMAMTLFQIKKYNIALFYIKQAISEIKAPRESWYQLYLSAYLSLKQYQNAAKVLKTIITLFPKKNYWMQLSAIYSILKQEKNALATLELAYIQGFLTSSSDILRLAYMYINIGVPIKASKILKKAIKENIVKPDKNSLSLLANSLTHAKEYKQAISPLLKVAKMSNSSIYYMQIAQLYIQLDDWSSARNSVLSALKTGNLTNKGNAYLLLGISCYNINKLKSAKKAFVEASKYENVRSSAKQWLDSIDRALLNG